MKRLILLVMACILPLGILAQEEVWQRKLAETRVEPPLFKGRIMEKPPTMVEKSPICCFVQDKLVYPVKASNNLQEGIVVIEFTIEPDATLTNFKVVNPVSFELDHAVINCLKQTRGMWIPGKVNGIPSAMEKKVYVMFDLEDTPPLIEHARRCYLKALDLYNRGCDCKEDTFVHARAKERKEKRFFNRSLQSLNYAQKYSPDEPAILFWQVRNYQELGNTVMFNQKWEQFMEVMHWQLVSNYLREDYDVAVVVLK